MKIAMLSYNSILPSKINGWVDTTLFMIQSENASGWGAQQISFGTYVELSKISREGIKQIQDSTKDHWDQLSELLPELDKVIIYVGDRGSEYTIKYAAEHKLDAEKAIFVLCSCNEYVKRCLIEKNGFSKALVVMCECGGRRTMERLASTFLENGQIFMNTTA